MKARDFTQKIVEANLPQTTMPQGKQPKLNLPPLVKGLILHWFLMYYGLHFADEPEIVNDRAGYEADLDKITKKLAQLGFAIQWVDNLPDLGDGGGGEGVYLTHVASKQTVGIDHYDIEQDYERFLPMAHKAIYGTSLEEGSKDACYHKVKSRYKVWPSAYASGALSKCRKVGAANWGNKSKK